MEQVKSDKQTYTYDELFSDEAQQGVPEKPIFDENKKTYTYNELFPDDAQDWIPVGKVPETKGDVLGVQEAQPERYVTFDEALFTTKEKTLYPIQRLYSQIIEKPAYAVAEFGLRALKTSLDVTSKLRPKYKAEEQFKERYSGWLNKGIEFYGQPEKTGLVTPIAEEKRLQYSAVSHQKNIAVGIINDIAESVTDVASLILTMRSINTAQAKGVVTNLNKSNLATIGKGIKTSAMHGFLTTKGSAPERIKAATTRIAYQITPYIANATGATGLTATAVDTLLNTFIGMPTYMDSFKSAYNSDEPLSEKHRKFITMALPQFIMDVGMALSTRGTPENQRKAKIKTYLQNRPEETQFTFKEKDTTVKDEQGKPVTTDKEVKQTDIKEGEEMLDKMVKIIDESEKQETERLVQEAKKYDTADEFIKAQKEDITQETKQQLTDIYDKAKAEVGGVERLYHGTSAKDFDKFEGDVVYLTSDPAEAKAFADSPIIGGGRGVGTSRVMDIDAPKGETKDIDSLVQETVMDGGDLDAVIVEQARVARKEGFDYLSFSHPSGVEGKDDFLAKVAINPGKLKIARAEIGGKVEAGGEGETKVRGLAKGVEAKAVQNKLTDRLGDLPEYKTISMKEQAEKSTELIKKDYDRAKRIAMGEELPPADILPESLFVAVENKAIKEGDIATLKDLATSSKLVEEATVMGQRIRTLGERDPESPVKAIQGVVQEREKRAMRKNKVKDIKKVIKSDVESIKKSVKKQTPTKETWTDFIKSLQC